jgi:hypothetical protein
MSIGRSIYVSFTLRPLSDTGLQFSVQAPAEGCASGPLCCECVTMKALSYFSPSQTAPATRDRIHRKGSRPIRRNTMAKGNNAQKKETKKPKKDSAKNGKKK